MTAYCLLFKFHNTGRLHLATYDSMIERGLAIISYSAYADVVSEWEMKTTMNGKPAVWPLEVHLKFQEHINHQMKADERIINANFFTPRPAVDEYNRGSRNSGFVFTVNPGLRVCIVQWIVF